MKAPKRYITEGELIQFKIFLIRKNKTLTEIAQDMGVSRTYVYSILEGKIPITERVRNMFKCIGFKLG